VAARARPHLLGIDDAPFEKGQTQRVPIVGVMMEGRDLVESVAVASFPVDGERATDFLADWVARMRAQPTLQGVVLGGITIAGLGLVDVRLLAERLSVPVLVVTRRDPSGSQLVDALRAARLCERIPLVERSPQALRMPEGCWLAQAGASRDEAERLVRASLRKALLPEPLRVAHLVARALVTGESRGRV
jgi:endonuclease V-like protein UPF0215 family